MDKVRRSWMVVPADKPEEIALAQGYLPDVLVLDLEYTVPPKNKEKARANLNDSIHNLYRTFPELFVRLDWNTRWADVRAAVYPGLKGFVLPGPETVDEIAELDTIVSRLEHERGVVPGRLEFVLMLESAKGFWNIFDLATASPRVTALGVGRIDLTMELGPEPSGEFRLAKFLMTRTLTAARAPGKQPLAAHFVAGSRGGVASKEATLKAAREGWQMGFTGYIAATPEQVPALNEGFTPSADYVKNAENIRKARTDGNAANVEVNGQLYDIFKTMRLEDILSFASQGQAQDKEKMETARQVLK
jgi:citrate lyase subunit beta/citryl-CoA lyase